MRKHYLIFISALFFSCSSDKTREEMVMMDYTSEEVSIEEFSGWMKEEATNLEKEKTIGEMKFSIRHNPADYMAMIELRNTAVSDSLWKETLSHYEDMEYYKFTMSNENIQGELLKDGIASASEYEERIKYYSFSFQNDIRMVCANDTLHCGMVHFERTFDLAPVMNFLIAFQKPQRGESDRTIIIEDRIFGNGRIKFSFTGKELTNYPKVIL